MPTWWTNPEWFLVASKHDPTKWWTDALAGRAEEVGGGRSEEQIEEEEQQDEDGDDDNDDNDDNDDSDDSDDNDDDKKGEEDIEISGEDQYSAGSVVRSLEELLAHAEEDEQVDQGDDNVGIKCNMFVPGVGNVNKRTICTWFADGREKLSNDRTTRAAQATANECPYNSLTFNISESPWLVQQGQDLAVLFDFEGKYRQKRKAQLKEAFIGRITRVRRLCGRKRWVEYVHPVDLPTAKKEKLDLRFTLCWYEAKRTVGAYVYGQHFSSEEVHLWAVICPVSLSYDRQTRTYTLPSDQRLILESNEDGTTTVPWEK